MPAHPQKKKKIVLELQLSINVCEKMEDEKEQENGGEAKENDVIQFPIKS